MSHQRAEYVEDRTARCARTHRNVAVAPLGLRDASNLRPKGATMSDLSARTAAGTQLSDAFDSARAAGYAAGSPQMLALDHAEDRWTLNKRAEPEAL